MNSVRTQLREIRSRLNELQKSIAIELSQIDRLIGIEAGDIKAPKQKVFPFVSKFGTRTIRHK